jgi:hypothetical protein
MNLTLAILLSLAIVAMGLDLRQLGGGSDFVNTPLTNVPPCGDGAESVNAPLTNVPPCGDGAEFGNAPLTNVPPCGDGAEFGNAPLTKSTPCTGTRLPPTECASIRWCLRVATDSPRSDSWQRD